MMREGSMPMRGVPMMPEMSCAESFWLALYWSMMAAISSGVLPASLKSFVW